VAKLITMPAIHHSPRVEKRRAACFDRRMMNVIIVTTSRHPARTLREYCEAEGDLLVVGDTAMAPRRLSAFYAQPPELRSWDIPD